MKNEIQLIEENYKEAFAGFHEYLIESYSDLVDRKMVGKETFPTIEEVTKKSYEQLHRQILDLLVKREFGWNIDTSEYEVYVAMYSNLFDQFAFKDKIEQHALFQRVCHDVKKYFTLYQLSYRDGDRIMNKSVMEVW